MLQNKQTRLTNYTEKSGVYQIVLYLEWDFLHTATRDENSCSVDERVEPRSFVLQYDEHKKAIS